MKLENDYIQSKKQEILNKYKQGSYPAIDYIKSASFLHFNQQYETAIDLLDLGLIHHPNNEEIIRAKFSFYSSSYNVLQALIFGQAHMSIFDKDIDDNFTKSLDIVLASLELSAPDHLTQQQTISLSAIIQSYLNEQDHDINMLMIGIIEEYKLPLIGLGFAYALSQQGNDLAQAILGASYLKGQHVEKNTDLGIKYLKDAAAQNNEFAQRMLTTFYSSIS